MTSALDILTPRFTESRVAPICGVYLLLRAGEIVYVGQSIDVLSRISSHVTEMRSLRGSAKTFDRCLWLEVSDADRLDYETALLRALVDLDVSTTPYAISEDVALTPEEEAAALRRELGKFGEAGKAAIARVTRRAR